MSQKQPGFGDLLKAKPQLSQPQTQDVEASGDQIVTRYRIYSQLLAIGEAKDREYVKTAVTLEEVVHVVKSLLPSDPRVIALEYIMKYAGNKDAVTALLRDVRDSCPEWLRPLIDIATGGK
ncbi:hypothetical protein [Vulcanisaeta souniana]|uniref:Uncharacterized protein n=1 Tax=Vulcanisaeta souniana JCM 11219 TaxID=1293586 RepID=A0ABN6SSY1_9CREN|nr:hypothetical protein [Vulcanisaeta souniana]BDR92231.1 hypothetical protein Vsou_13240 [Vulcanisaeta souniana JCM 11219]